MALDVNVVQIQGGRRLQEDSVLVRDIFRGLIVLVADGLGGHERGDEASRVACLSTFKALEVALLKTDSAASALRKAFVTAHKAVQKIPAPHRLSPASTLVGGFFSTEDKMLHAASIGDSLAFLFRDSQAKLLFRPQTDEGAIAHALGLDMGNARGSAVELHDPIKLRLGDKLLFASDGIEALDQEHILESLALPTAREGSERMAQLLINQRREYQDNATIAIVHVKSI